MGRVCGGNSSSGDLTARRYLLYFDLTRCLNPAVLAYGCNTPQVTRMAKFCAPHPKYKDVKFDQDSFRNVLFSSGLRREMPE